MTSISNTRALSVADILRDRIFSGEMPPGTHLMEVILANELGVSRTPVRDALARLADDGLLVYHPNRGFLVRQFDAKDVFDAFTLRAALEGLNCRFVGERGLKPEAQARLYTLLDAQQSLLDAGRWTLEDRNTWQDLNLDFHSALLELSSNIWLGDAVRRARQLPIVFDSKSRPHDRESLRLQYHRTHTEQALNYHYRIVDSLVNCEITRAEQLMEEHILTNRDILVKALRTSQDD